MRRTRVSLPAQNPVRSWMGEDGDASYVEWRLENMIDRLQEHVEGEIGRLEGLIRLLNERFDCVEISSRHPDQAPGTRPGAGCAR